MTERELFLSASEITDPIEQQAFLSRECEDAQLRQRISAMLDFHATSNHFLDENQIAAQSLEETFGPIEKAGSIVGKYKLLEEIGEGGYGIVYMAEQLEPVRRRVALKIIKPGMDTREVVARFEAERQALALMDHPNIARVLDGGATQSERPYFVMELVDGTPITEFCDVNRLETVQRLELFSTVCRAVQHAHLKGIIHRDIKPSNVLVTLQDGASVPKVIDFGIAKAIDQRLTDKTLFTHHGQFIGTPNYMSPEQAERSSLDVDTRSDVYSLGVLLYELLTGHTPLDSDQLKSASLDEIRRLVRDKEAPTPSSRISTTGNMADTVAKHRGTEPIKLRQVVQGELDWITLKALSKERGRRYESASIFSEDIQRYLNHQPVEAGPPSSLYHAVKFVRRNRGIVAATAAVGASLLLGVLISILSFVQLTQTVSKLEESEDKLLQTVGMLKDSEGELKRTIAELKDSRNREAERALVASANFELMRGMLESVDPNTPDYTVLEMLDDMREELPEKLIGMPPEVRANHRLVIGKLYTRLGEQHRALPIFQSAVADRREQGDQVALASSLVDLTENALACCYLNSAEAAAAEAVELLGHDSSERSKKARDLLKTSRDLTAIQHKVLASMRVYEHHLIADDLKVQLEGDPQLKLSGVVSGLLIFLFADLGRFDDAKFVCTFNSSSTPRSYILGANGHAYLHFMLGFLAEKQGDFEAADRHFQRVLDVKDDVSVRNIDNAWVQALCAWAILRKNDLSPEDIKEAEERIKLLVEFLEEAKTPVINSISSVAFHVMAQVREKQNDLESAIGYQLRAFEECKRPNMPRHMLIQLEVEEQLARLFLLNGDEQSARVTAKTAIDWRRTTLDKDHYQNQAAEERLTLFLKGSP